MGVLCRAKLVVVIVVGEDKRDVVQGMLRGDDALPIVRVLKHPVKKKLFLDQAAARTSQP
jgi:6-phosphogluconolactonase/glucosamine-6-phosphate isomerase/deaminase